MNLRTAFATATILLLSCNAFSKALLIPLPQMVSSADLIVTGTISAVHADTFEFTVGQWFRPSGDSRPVITVSKFRNWTCWSRMWPYETGQTFCLFLKHPRKGVTEAAQYPEIIGSSDEGEIPLLNGKVYLINHLAGRESTTTHKIFGKELRARMTTVEEIVK